jgi:hypothetical protein
MRLISRQYWIYPTATSIKFPHGPADTSHVTSFQPAAQPTSWLFTRGDSSVRMTVDDQSPGALPPGTDRDDPLVLIVRGPGTAVATYDFPDMKALMDFAALEERKLQTAGFQLQAIAERRSADRSDDTRSDRRDRRR